MGLYDDILVEQQPVPQPSLQAQSSATSTGLFDDLLVEQPEQPKPTFADSHPFIASVPEAGKQFGVRAVKSFPEFAKGLNDLVALAGDKTHLQGLSDFGRSNAEFWQQQSDKIQIDPKYQGLQGLKSKETFLPTVLGSVGDQATNLLTAAGGGAGGAKLAAQAGLKGLAKAGVITAGTSVPNLAQEGSYLDKIDAFQAINGRMPTQEELAQIQNVAIGEKAVNTALETVSDRLLFGKIFPEGAVTKGVKGVLKNAGQQALTEAGTEGMQESVSIGAEKLLGLNQGDNASRLLDAMAIGGVTGGVIGGGSNLVARPYNTQFAENQNNNVNPVEAVKNVSAQIVNNGKVLYDSAADSFNNVVNNVNNAVNQPSSFDVLMQLSREGNLHNRPAELAPNIAEKAKVKKARKAVKSPETISNQSENTNTEIMPVENVQNAVSETQNLTPEIANKEKVSKTKAKQREKAAAKERAIAKIKEIAPNITAKKEELTNAQKDVQLSRLKKEVGIGGILRDDEGSVYEVLDQNGYMRNVDTGEVSIGDVKRSYEKYVHDNNELLKVQPFNYDENAKGDTNRDNYVFSKQEAVDAYNNYIQKPTEANREIYQDTVGRLHEEYQQIEPELKNTKPQNTVKVPAKLQELAPKTVEKLQKTNSPKQNNEVNNKNFRKINDEHTARIMQVYNKYTQQEILAGKANSEIEAINKEFEPLEKVALAPNITEKAANKKAKKYKAPSKEIPEGTSKKGDVAWYLNKDDKKPKFYSTMAESNEIGLFKAESNSYEELLSKLPYAPTSRAIVEYYQKAGVPFSEFNPEYNGNIPETTNKGGVLNGHVTETVNADGRRVSEEKETAGEESSGVSQEEPANERTSDQVGRGDDVSDVGRGISQKDKEIIEKEYKNQHELNKAIEDYINNGEYKKYAGSVRMPQEVKDWLKKYSGAGGLEKQGAAGKGLLSEYYTPANIVKKMWDITSQYVDTNGAKVLEPSVGVGRFIEYAPENTSFDAVEMNPVSARITKILYPDTNVETGEFQERFINKENNTPVKNVEGKYDIVIGNPPYGQYSGRYKGMGEGKKFSRLEAYFINRGLDSLKENGVMTFIVPSSFLDGAITAGKQEIGKKCELLDAYRLPENTFDTTSIGTDIVVLRKTSRGKETNINLGKWFEAHPEKILGTVEQRKSRFGGKMENYVKGDKNAVDSIDTSKKAIKKTELSGNTGELKGSVEKTVKKRSTVKKNLTTEKVGNTEYKEYVPKNTVSDEDLQLFNDTRVDGTLPKSKYSPNEKVNMYDGELYNDFNYLQGDIYEKLDALEHENISENQKEIQRKKLEKVLPKPKEVKQIQFNPTSDFIRELVMGQEETTEYDYSSRQERKVTRPVTLDKKYLQYVEHLTNSERDGVSTWDIRSFINGNKIRIDYHYSSYSLSKAEMEKERNMQKAAYLTKLKNTVDKTFNDFVQNELTKEERKKLSDAWNRNFNAVYNPDYEQMPLLIKELNSEFYGKPLELQNVQIEGINFLTNKGVGLLGFEVGTGKTLSGIIATVRNMQSGRCKRPLILVPKQVKNNWIREIKQSFPNMPVNDVDNMSKFSGEIPENSLTVATYEALGNIWYGDRAAVDLIHDIYSVSNDFNRDSTERGKEKAKERAGQILGLAEKGNKKQFSIQDLGFDHITVDEAHNFKNLFADAKADGQEGNTYVNITGGSTSTRAARLFLLAQYILNNNNNRNVFMLTATPFNNSPIEVFNMMSFIGKDKLDKMGLYNVYQFMENYADISSDWIVNSRNEVEYKQIVTGFKNAGSLRELIKSVMLIRSAEDAGIKRPEKYTRRVVLEPSQSQLDLIAKAEQDAVSGNKNDGAVLKAINQSRKATLSPDIAADNFDVSPEDLIKNSPKLEYIAKAVASMKKKDPKTSQLIYMPLGVKYLPKIKQYFVNKGIFKADEVAIIDSGVSDDKISQITDSFNDVDGKVKLIIGTNKIKEGMNLNKNSSVLYVPYMDWNPTDFMQIVGRIWRRGNRYSKIRVVVPLLKNSSDSFMFQKLNEKTDRINNIMDESREYIDTSELNTAEEKINMISNPDKKVRMFIKVEQQKLEAQVKELQGRLETANSYKNSLESDERILKNTQERFNNLKKEIKELDPEKNKWDYEYKTDNMNRYKRDIAAYTASLKRTKEKIKRLELDFEGKDSEDVINSEIQKIQENINQLEEYGKKKLVEYQKEYESERLNSKTVSDLIKEFERDTETLYEGGSESFEMPIITNIVNNYKDFTAFNDSIKNGKSIKELCKTEPLFMELKDELSDVSDYIVTAMPQRLQRKGVFGKHYGSQKLIHLNMAAIGDNVEVFTRTLMHEIQHAKQESRYRELLSKGKNFTEKEKSFIKSFQECKRVNREKQNFYNKHRKFLDDIMKGLNGLNVEQKQNFINNLSPKERDIVDKYYELYENYKNAAFEVEARKAGKSYAEEIRRLNSGKTDRITGIRREWAVRAGSHGGSTEGQRRRSYPLGRYDAGASEDVGIGLSGLRRQAEQQNIADKAEKATEELLDYNNIDEILPKVKNSRFTILKKVFTPISTRLEEINPKLKYAIRKFEYDFTQTENKYAAAIKPFIEKLDKMPVADYAKYDLALKNGKTDIVNALNEKYGIKSEYKAVRNLLDKIRQEALDTDLEVGMIEDYFPRKVINPAAIIEHYSKSSFIRKYLREIDPYNTLSDEEKLAKINSALRGTNQAIKTTSSFTKGRKISSITKDLNRYYKDSRSALVDYITNMNNAIQVRKFFGKGDNLDESIGSYTKNLLDNGLISPAEETELKEILKSRFTQHGVSGIVSDLKNIGYVSTMGNPFSAITQIGDLAFTLYRNGVWNSFLGLKQTVSRNNNITKEDLGISKIAQEFESDSKTAKLVDKTFKFVGLDYIDRLGKETYINASYQRLKQQADKAIFDGKVQKKSKFYNELHDIFGKDTTKVIKDLSSGRISENVKYLLFCDISDFQPISLSEMPQVYLTSGNGRIAYMLKTYSIKLVDVYRNEVFRQMKTNPKKAIGNLVRLTFYTAMLGVGADSLKDLLMGREINLGDTFLDNIFKLAMLSKYQVENFRKDGIGKALLSSALPPTNVFDDLYKDITDKKIYTGEKPVTNIKTIRNIPFAGKLYYWWFGAGKEVREKEFKANRKADYLRALKTGNPDLSQRSTDKLVKAGYDTKAINKIKKRAESKYSEPYENAYKKALQQQNYNKVRNIADKLERDKVPATLRREIYLKALREYYSERRVAQ